MRSPKDAEASECHPDHDGDDSPEQLAPEEGEVSAPCAGWLASKIVRDPLVVAGAWGRCGVRGCDSGAAADPEEPIDPPPKAAPDLVQDLDHAEGATTAAIGAGYRALIRFNYARSTLLATDTTYHVVLALCSLIALAYGVTAIFNADRMAS